MRSFILHSAFIILHLLPMATPELSSSGLPQDLVEQLGRLYADAAQRMSDIVLHPWGKTQTTKEWKQARAAMLAAQIDGILQSLKVQTAHWLGTHLAQAFVDGIQRAQTQARAVGVDAPPLSIAASFGLIDTRAVEIIARDILGDLVGNAPPGSLPRNGAAANTADQAKRLLRATAQTNLSETDIDQVIAQGVIDGTPAAAMRNLRDQFRAIGDGKVRVRDKNGSMMEFDAGYYASMVIRTKTRQATVEARHGRLRELGLDLVAIVGRISQHFCTAYLGQVYSLSGRSTQYPAYSSLPGGGPPFHPNCSKSTRPFVEELASDQQLDAAAGDDDQAKMLGHQHHRGAEAIQGPADSAAGQRALRDDGQETFWMIRRWATITQTASTTR
jgi:hypothetical protein